jgi:REP element-mobilizing transposase RayT
MIRNDAGDMIHKWYYELESKFPDIRCHEMIVTPDHIHFIIAITDVTPLPYAKELQLPQLSPTDLPLEENQSLPPELLTICTGAPLSQIIQWFKTMSTNEYIRGVKTKNWTRFDRRLWQRNYYAWL